LSSKKSLNIAILLDETLSYDREVVVGFTKFFTQFPNYSSYLIPPSYLNHDTKNSWLHKLENWKPDGVIFRTFANWQILTSLNVPLIASPFYSLIDNVPNLKGDDEEIAKMAFAYFCKKGFSNYAFFGDQKLYWSLIRQQTFKTCVENSKFNYFAIPDNISELAWHKQPEVIAKWLKEQPYPLAIYAATDNFARIIVESIRIAELTCPYQVAILGTDNDVSICESCTPRLSSIDQNAEYAGYEAAKHLHKLIGGEQIPVQNISVPPKCIVERKSTDVISITDVHVSKAIQFIEQNAIKKNINVTDVLSAVCCSRRLLETRFQELIQSSIYMYIKRVRIKHIKHLLLNTNLSIKEIAIHLDFSNIDNISRYFARETEMSPLEFRKKFKV
jgi:LacI family transcriptional regulator